jgi:hypothetical protein
MADSNRITDENTSNAKGSHRITSMRLFDLAGGSGKPPIVIKATRQIEQSEQKSEAKRLKTIATASPWTDDRLGKAFANKSLNANKLKDPLKELQKFTDSMSRR